MCTRTLYCTALSEDSNFQLLVASLPNHYHRFAMNFAQDQLKKYGWSKGKGLGRSESGIVDAIKPKLKFDTAGVGHDAGEQFSFHWWDHVFNKAAKNIEVENGNNGVNVKRKGAKSNLISNKKTAQVQKKSLMYGSFVKHGTLNPSGLEAQEEPSSSSSSSESEPEDCPLESYEGHDEMLYKACGGRTAHKGARHGLTLSGKLQRIEQQDSLQGSEKKVAKLLSDVGLECNGAEDEEEGKKKQKKKKKKRKLAEIEENGEGLELLDDDIEERTVEESQEKVKRKKKKKKSKDRGSKLDSESAENAEQGSTDNALTSLISVEDGDGSDSGNKRKRTKKRKAGREDECLVNNDGPRMEGHDAEDEEREETQKKKRKKKKSKKRQSLDVGEMGVIDESHDSVVDEPALDKSDDGASLMGKMKRQSKKKKKSKLKEQCL